LRDASAANGKRGSDRTRIRPVRAGERSGGGIIGEKGETQYNKGGKMGGKGK